MIKPRKQENISISLAVLSAFLGIADAKPLLENLLLYKLFLKISNYLNKLFHTSDCITPEFLFSLFWLLLILEIYFNFVRTYLIKPIPSKDFPTELAKLIKSSRPGFLRKFFDLIVDLILKVKFGNELIVYVKFNRFDIAGEITSDGINIPPKEDFDCENFILRTTRLDQNKNYFNEEFRFHKHYTRLKIRSYTDNIESKYGDFQEINLNLSEHYWLFFIYPFNLIKWSFKNSKKLRILLISLSLTLLLTLKICTSV
ncbi:hypothetical protein [Leptospira bandrabouensis]|uniref:hypothetical protein n=1 Tax=Leptospira bandrabouensis TaxID=2484903 RepID=UPI001EEA7F85|nr:hypothetical protein [Leptospira bandrabouensis]MCG6154109.1 hypothetical protein [Leptospira bandrabouensis]